MTRSPSATSRSSRAERGSRGKPNQTAEAQRGKAAAKAKPALTQRRRATQRKRTLCESLRLSVKSSQLANNFDYCSARDTSRQSRNGVRKADRKMEDRKMGFLFIFLSGVKGGAVASGACSAHPGISPPNHVPCSVPFMAWGEPLKSFGGAWDGVLARGVCSGGHLAGKAPPTARGPKNLGNPGQNETYFLLHRAPDCGGGERLIHLTRRGTSVSTNKIKGFVRSLALPRRAANGGKPPRHAQRKKNQKGACINPGTP
jgi:hypothetical protein